MSGKKLCKKMTLEEKAALLSGKNEWQTRDLAALGLQSIFFSDGPHGVRKQEGSGDHLGLGASRPATCFPTAATVAGSWDTRLAEEIGEALGTEAGAQGVDVLLGPGLNIKRSPLCGRNFEYFSEDPYLSGKLAAAYVRGIQSKGIYACPKHYAVNSQETRRMATNSVVDERALREIYLTGFEMAVKEGGAGTLMSAYNEVNGIYANENPHLLEEILRREWGFEGFVVTDWGASNDVVEGTKAGSNLEMPAPGLAGARDLVEAVKSGSLSEEVLDKRVEELLSAILTLTERRREGRMAASYDQKAHHALARRAAAESAVLLKNEEKILPISSAVRVAVIGDFAYSPRYQGAGSSVVNCTQLDTVADLLPHSGLTVVGMARGYRRDGEEDERLLEEAVALAKSAEVVLYFFGLDELSESEGLDRGHMGIPPCQIRVLEAIFSVNPRIVGVVSAGASLEMPWISKTKALLHGYLGGQAGAGALLDILTGAVCPGGKLAETYPLSYEDTPAFSYYPAKERDGEYRESLFVGYRYYDTAQVPVLFPFGYGLSYTSFSYRDLEVTKEGVSFFIKNTGERAGAEIAQLYVGLEASALYRPKKELKGFAKVFLQPGEEKQIQIPFDDKTFRYWDVQESGWREEGGVYTLQIGAHSSDIRLEKNLERAGNAKPVDRRRELPSYYRGEVRDVAGEEFGRLFYPDRPALSGAFSRELEINDALSRMKDARGRIGRWAYGFLEKKRLQAEKKGKPDLNVLFVYNMPFRAIAKMSHGKADLAMVSGILDMVNGHFFRGLGKLTGGYFKNQRLNKEYERRYLSSRPGERKGEEPEKNTDRKQEG